MGIAPLMPASYRDKWGTHQFVGKCYLFRSRMANWNDDKTTYQAASLKTPFDLLTPICVRSREGYDVPVILNPLRWSGRVRQT